MRTVGVRELKSQLSHYLRLVKEGERIFITEHDRVIAELSGKDDYPGRNSVLDDYLSRKAEEGKIIPAERKGSIVRRVGGEEIAVDWKAVYDEAREDRR